MIFLPSIYSEYEMLDRLILTDPVIHFYINWAQKYTRDLLLPHRVVPRKELEPSELFNRHWQYQFGLQPYRDERSPFVNPLP